MRVQHLKRERDRRPHPQPPGHPARALPDRILGLIQIAQDLAHLFVIGLPQPGRAQRAGGAGQKLCAQTGLKIRDIFADKAAGNAHPPGRSCKTALVNDMHIGAQNGSIHHMPRFPVSIM